MRCLCHVIYQAESFRDTVQLGENSSVSKTRSSSEPVGALRDSLIDAASGGNSSRRCGAWCEVDIHQASANRSSHVVDDGESYVAGR